MGHGLQKAAGHAGCQGSRRVGGQAAAGRPLDVEEQTFPGQKEGGQSSRRSQRQHQGPLQCLQVKTWPKRWALPTWGRVAIALRAACGIEPPSQRPLERAPGADRAGGTSLGQSLPHTRSLWCGSDPTQKLQGQQPYMAARYEALLNKDKEEDPAFSPVPSSGLHFRQPRSRRGSQVPPGFTLAGGEPIPPSP